MKNIQFPLKIIQESIEAYYGIPEGRMFMDSRKMNVVRYRQIFHYLARTMNHGKISFEEIGKYHKNNFNHATVLHSVRTIEDEMDVNRILTAEVSTIRNNIHIELGENPIITGIDFKQLGDFIKATIREELKTLNQ